MTNNKLIVAAAGSGKTTFLVDEALNQHNAKILITTYTESNEAEIRKKIIERNKYIPDNITVQTWFSFLLEHGVKPYQGVLFKKNIKGMLLVNEQSGLKYKTNKGIPVYYKEADELEKHYFTSNQRIYSDKLSKFVVRCNDKSGGAVIDRLSKIYTHIFIDEVQDLAGYDLEFLKLLFSSTINTLLVGDPRQGTYSTSNSQKNKKYQKSKILTFFEDKSIQIETDQTTLVINYRCPEPICVLSNKLFPDLPQTKSGNFKKNNHTGVFFVKRKDVNKYLETYSPVQLRWDKKVKVHDKYLKRNFGETKGLTFQRVLVYPTQIFAQWIKNNCIDMPPTSRAKYYVALTRAEYSVAILYDYEDGAIVEGIQNYSN
jgi:ATP-dependent exoDNAse (exonuclease V) beta subunit